MNRILVIGLGNYTLPSTRHNAGMMALNHTVKHMESLSLPITNWSLNKAAGGYVSECILRPNDINNINKNTHIIFLKPKEFMNLSGASVKKSVQLFGIDYKNKSGNVLVVHDDLEVKFGSASLKNGGSAKGHNGVLSISNSLGTRNFSRVRIGIDRPPGPAELYVLEKFSVDQLVHLDAKVFPTVYDLILQHLAKE